MLRNVILIALALLAAFALLGLDAYCSATSSDGDARRVRRVLADRLLALLAVVERPQWVWFEEGLAYDNARLPQALIVTGMSTGRAAYTEAGLRTLSWLSALQTTAAGYFRPVGSGSFGDRQRMLPKPFDQQPLEAAAMISAALAAWRADGDSDWKANARRAFEWFLGSNDLAVSLVDLEIGSCCDGLHPDRRNENRGGESVVSWLLALSELRRIVYVSESRAKRAARLA